MERALLPLSLATAAVAFVFYHLGKRHCQAAKLDSNEIQTPVSSASLSNVSFGVEARSRLFRIDPQIMPMNHGSYGTVPLFVWEYQKSAIAKIENVSDLFFRYDSLIECRQVLAQIAPVVGLKDDSEIVFVTNATTGVAAVAQSLVRKKLIQAGDAVLTLDLAYNAIKNILLDICEQSGAHLIQLHVSLPVKSSSDIVHAVRAFLASDDGKKVKFAVFDHITSATAMVLPVRELSALCHEYSIPVFIDGAHAIGQLPIDLSPSGIGCDFYTSNFHKWYFSPKGSAFLFVARKFQEAIHPLVTSHEWRNDFQHRFWQQGTRDYSPFLAVKAAFQFIQDVGADRITQYNTSLCQWAAGMLRQRWHTVSEICSPSLHAPFMHLVQLPGDDPTSKEQKVVAESPLSSRIMELLIKQEKCVGVVQAYRGKLYVRLCANIYNTQSDFVRFAELLEKLLREHRDTHISNVN